ncbi:iron ABC transporter substrate-binding protein [Bacillus coahuilensis p1.1.43]|uniref:Iron ABC transporter substrate-binding protein n=1 Tax=Bacillus coahuilensis p1.1.43 TaxID=1150625 RepID=A0A147K8E8_9BACI|nr:ABC transporter substrate-binding protein [Bacillus coahuilensis]KUP06407.1 iron ABC transporter substrate-binding protein [Bacillus coahuilensis p1.1.43]
MKNWKKFLLISVFSTSLVACGNTDQPVEEGTGMESSEGENEEFPVTITDATGEEILIKNDPEKIISLIPSNTEILFEIGTGEDVIAVTDNDNYPEEVMDLEKVGGFEINVEKIIALEPDMVFAHESGLSSMESGLQQIKDAGITVLVVDDASNFDEVYSTIEFIGQATGFSEEALEVVGSMKNELEAIVEKTKTSDLTPSVFFEVSPSPEIYTAGSNTFLNEIVVMLNAENAASDIEGWAMLNDEQIIDRNPEVIITTYGYYVENPIEQVLSRTGWESVDAIKNERVIDIHSDLVTRTGPRLVEGVEEVAKAIYPEVFTQ